MYVFLVDSLYQHYLGIEERMGEALRIFLGEEVEKRVEMGLAKNGSGVGGASTLGTLLRRPARANWSSAPSFQLRWMICKQRRTRNCNLENN